MLKDMSLLYTADMYTTMKHKGIKEYSSLLDTAEEAKEKVRFFDKCGLSMQYSYCHGSGNGHLLCALVTKRSVFHTVHIWLAGKKKCRRDRSELDLTLHCAMVYPNVESVLIAASLRQIAWALMEKAVWILPNVWAAAFVLPPALLAHAYLRPDRTTIMRTF